MLDPVTNRLVTYIQRHVVSPISLVAIYVQYAAEDREALPRIVSATTPEDLDETLDLLGLYPSTDLAWTSLPADRASHTRPGLSLNEHGDLRARRYQEDRPHVEFLRQTIPSAADPERLIWTGDKAKFIDLVQEETLSKAWLTRILFRHAPALHTDIEAIISAMSRKQLEGVFSARTIYPWTDFGWSILPATRLPYSNTASSTEELADLAKLQFQEDRAHVEAIMNLVRPLIDRQEPAGLRNRGTTNQASHKPEARAWLNEILNVLND